MEFTLTVVTTMFQTTVLVQLQVQVPFFLQMAQPVGCLQDTIKEYIVPQLLTIIPLDLLLLQTAMALMQQVFLVFGLIQAVVQLLPAITL